MGKLAFLRTEYLLVQQVGEPISLGVMKFAWVEGTKGGKYRKRGLIEVFSLTVLAMQLRNFLKFR